MTFVTNHFSSYAVGYNKVEFKDVGFNDSYADAVSFIAAREITSGTGTGTFGPADTLTRGQFITLLLKAYEISLDANPSDNFKDAGNTYYTEYLAAAKKLGISGGVGDNRFEPGKAISRQEMYTLLCKTLKQINMQPKGASEKKLSDFTDSGEIAGWAEDSVKLLLETGKISGNAGKLSPAGAATRAEMAQVLYNLIAE
ncbi:S-layer family protein [Ruminiclostridium sufflavum DSM 19573]|uniref:S-layer family protein n=1 Tax=Ruminiclostridium sufflavum DSM 19573 TaxID=1121337 RepID=A0A318XQY5_9FIRM|nr:S-layer family protein [Ruminiclostridium sufflavum DSM 19573]